jgi:hypothetical protein
VLSDVAGEPPKDVGLVSPSIAESHEKKAPRCVAKRIDRDACGAQGCDLCVCIHVAWQLQGDRRVVDGASGHCIDSVMLPGGSVEPKSTPSGIPHL